MVVAESHDLNLICQRAAASQESHKAKVVYAVAVVLDAPDPIKKTGSADIELVEFLKLDPVVHDRNQNAMLSAELDQAFEESFLVGRESAIALVVQLGVLLHLLLPQRKATHSFLERTDVVRTKLQAAVVLDLVDQDIVEVSVELLRVGEQGLDSLALFVLVGGDLSKDCLGDHAICSRCCDMKVLQYRSQI